MKTSILFILSFIGGILPIKGQPTTADNSLLMRDTKIVMYLDDYCCSEDQWVYARIIKGWISGNELMIVDSVFVKKGQHTATLEFPLPISETTRLIFSRKGPDALQVMAEPGKVLKIAIHEGDDGVAGPAIEGELHNRFSEHYRLSREYRTLLKNTTDSLKLDSIKQERFEQLCTMLENEEHANLAAIYVTCIKLDFLPEKAEEFKAICEEQSWKYPYWSDGFYNKKYYLPESAASAKSDRRMREIWEQKRKANQTDTSIGQPLDIAFWNEQNEKTSLQANPNGYVLVDFWASWCKPCRKETPFVLQALEKYKNRLAVYAVSLDTKRDAWQKAIEEDGTQQFLHTIAANEAGRISPALKNLGIHMIPANFLIDKDKRIVAKDLRGEQLTQTLDSLLEQ